MVASAVPRTVSMFEETTFNTAPADWDASGEEIHVMNLNLDGIQQEVIENTNHVQRPGESHLIIKGVKQHEFSFDVYMHGSPSTPAAEDAQAVNIDLTTLLKAYAGGRKLGYAKGIASGTATNPVLDSSTNITADADAGFFYDTSAAKGYFRTIEADAASTLTLYGGDLPFTPDGGGADVMNAVITAYPHWDALTDHADADHKTLGFSFQGKHVEDVYQCFGCKPNITLNELTPNTPSMLSAAIMGTSFLNETLTQDDLDETPTGEPGIVVGTGSDTLFYLGAKDGAYTTRECYSLTPRLGVTHTRLEGPCGQEGTHGYVGARDDPGLTVVLPYDDDFATAFRADPTTEYMALIQVGTALQKAWGIEFMRLELAENPIRTEVNGVTAVTLNFRALEYDGTVAVTGDDLEWNRAFWRLYLVA